MVEPTTTTTITKPVAPGEELIEAHDRKNHKISYLKHMLLLMMVYLPSASKTQCTVNWKHNTHNMQ